jgi:tetratricopeptide (TPR) repeat protein
MAHGTPEPGETQTARAARIEAIVQELLRGDAADGDTRIQATHPDLQPELGERIRVLRAIQAAQQAATRRAAAPDARASVLDEERAVLERALVGYEILERLQHGGQGAVYRGVQVATKRAVAIKVLLDGPLASDRQRARFEREAEVTSRLRHPNIVTLFEYGVVRGRPFLAMEYVAGLPITDYALLHDLSPRAIVALCMPVCQAVHYAHQNGIIHRDLNPANVLVDENGVPRVLDFGLAKDTWAPETEATYSQTGQIVGTLPYMSPEQVGAPDAIIDVRSDVYALGVVLYELLTGCQPHDPSMGWVRLQAAILTADAAPLHQVLTRDFERPTELNRDLEAVVLKALRKDKGARYQSAAELAADLERYLAGDAVHARAGSRAYMLRKALRRHRRLVTVAASFCVIAAVAVGAVLRALAVAQRERDQARKASRVAYDLFDRVLDLDESLRPLAGGVAVRDDLLTGVSATIPRLGELVAGDPAFADLAARTLEKQGDIAALQGQKAEAERCYQALLGERLTHWRTAPDDPERVIEAARTYRKLATTQADGGITFEHGITLVEDARRAAPAHVGLRRALLELRLEYAGMLGQTLQHRAALEEFDAGLALNGPELERDIGPVHDQVARAHSGRARALVGLGRAAEALASYRRSAELREAICLARPADTNARYALMSAYVNLGGFLAGDKRTAEALDYWRRAARIGETLHELDPRVLVWARDLYGVHHRIADQLVRDGDLAGARTEAEHAVRVARELMAMRGDTTEAIGTLAFALELRGNLALRDGEVAGAWEAFTEAVAAAARARALEPGNARWARDLATSLVWLGIASRRDNVPEQALLHYGRALAIREELLADNPENPELECDVVENLINLAAAQMSLGSPADDAQAKDALCEADFHLDSLQRNGRMSAVLREYERARAAIDRNLEILDERAREADADAP